MPEFLLKADSQDARMRLDVWLLHKAKEHKIFLSRMRIKKLIGEGKITLNGSARKAHYKIKPEDRFKVILDEQKESEELKPADIPLDIIYQDEDLAVINKPPGLVVHPGAGNKANTLVNSLIHHFKNLSRIDPQRPGIVHRLDKDTSGLIVIAKSDKAHLDLISQFAEHTIKRRYVALVKGYMEFDENIVELPISRHMKDRKKMAINFNQYAKYAKTHYRTLIRTEKASLLELTPFTGRTHQLRVHLAHLGHPILGDPKYGKDNQFPRLALHARGIGFRHPSFNRYMEFSTPLPEKFLDYFPGQLKKKISEKLENKMT
jgi:23S rRNA pseudouridine1911/1915/1917 synthase